MSFETWMAFAGACALLALLPGPAIALFVATSMTRGARAGLLAYGGNTLGLALMVLVAGLGMAPLLAMASYWFDILRLAGALFLLWMGWSMLRRGMICDENELARVAAGGRYFAHGLATSFSNPKVLLFLGAFFPQFINPQSPMVPQLALLGVTFVIIHAINDLLVVLLASWARRWLLEKQCTAHMIGGGLLMGAGAGLALVRR